MTGPDDDPLAGLPLTPSQKEVFKRLDPEVQVQIVQIVTEFQRGMNDELRRYRERCEMDLISIAAAVAEVLEALDAKN